MPVIKKSDGWYWGSKGPFATKAKALAVGRAAHASGFKEDREKNLVISIDYHNTYTTDPKTWNVVIQLLMLRKQQVICISHDFDDDKQEIIDSLGKQIGADNIYMTNGKAKMDWAKDNGIDVDIWIDNNPLHIIEDPKG